VWFLLARRAQKEYLYTVQSRLERRRLDLSAPVNFNDPAMVRLLEETTVTGHPRQICYALKLLAEVTDYDLTPVLGRLVTNPAPAVRAKVFELAWFTGFDELLPAAVAELQTAERGHRNPALKPAVDCVLAFSDQPQNRAREFLDHPNMRAGEAVLECLRAYPEWTHAVITDDWLSKAVHDADHERRYLAAVAIGVGGEEGSIWLPKLMADPDLEVVGAACRSAGGLRNRACVDAIVGRLADARMRGVAIQSLTAYGSGIVGFLGDVLGDESVSPIVRRQIPRVLKQLLDQASVDVLVKSIAQQDLSVRLAVLKALSTMREQAPRLHYGDIFVTEQILTEARHYFALYAALEPFRDQQTARSAAGLLHRSIEERLKQTLERLFRLMGLRYPPMEMHSAWLAVTARRKEQFLAALEFLDTVLEPRLKRVVMPMLDSTEQVVQRGRDLFGLEVRDVESAVRDLLESGDPWLKECALAAAAEQKVRVAVADRM
jgi:ATP:ADP antiporter, AAA family